jgi:hypothetical protein
MPGDSQANPSRSTSDHELLSSSTPVVLEQARVLRVERAWARATSIEFSSCVDRFRNA